MVDLELARKCVDLLNKMAKMDHGATTELINHRVPCNQDMANDPDIQTGRVETLEGVPNVERVGLLGVLNGLCGSYEDGSRKGLGPVCVVVDDEEGIIEARILYSQTIMEDEFLK